MKLSTILLAFVLLDAGNVCAQEVGPEKKATAYMVADAHLDTQWNWDIQTTIKEYVWNTLSRNLFLLKKYPNYIFNFECCTINSNCIIIWSKPWQCSISKKILWYTIYIEYSVEKTYDSYFVIICDDVISDYF